MRMGTQSRICGKLPWLQSVATAVLVVVFLVLSASQSANALPAFARKYGLRCSACHESWPMLNYFGQKFKDNGYQLMNDRDAPIWQNASYWPITLRITPFWSRESTNKVAVDTATGTGETRLTTTGFNLSGLDILTGGTLEKNISFLFVPSADEIGAFHFESANVRFDNLFHSPWLNVKTGKFELDSFISEKRTLTLSASGGEYQLFHFIPVNDGNIFGQLGDNQLGAEWMGHSADDRTRLSAAVFSSTDGNVDLPYGQNSYSCVLRRQPSLWCREAGRPTSGRLCHGGHRSDHISNQCGRAHTWFGYRQQELQSCTVSKVSFTWEATWTSRCSPSTAPTMPSLELATETSSMERLRVLPTTPRVPSRPEPSIQPGMGPLSKPTTFGTRSSPSSSARSGSECRNRRFPELHPTWGISTTTYSGIATTRS